MGQVPGEANRGFKKENPGQLSEPGSSLIEAVKEVTSMIELAILIKVVVGVIAVAVLVQVRFRMKL